MKIQYGPTGLIIKKDKGGGRSMTKKRLTTDADLFRMLIDEVKTQEPIALELLHTYKEFLLLKGVIEIDGRGNMWRLEYTEDWDGTND